MRRISQRRAQVKARKRLKLRAERKISFRRLAAHKVAFARRECADTPSLAQVAAVGRRRAESNTFFSKSFQQELAHRTNSGQTTEWALALSFIGERRSAIEPMPIPTDRGGRGGEKVWGTRGTVLGLASTNCHADAQPPRVGVAPNKEAKKGPGSAGNVPQLSEKVQSKNAKQMPVRLVTL